MTEGILEMNTLPNKEVMYVPAGKKKGMPLRVVSAVVTELSPLILIGKHKKREDLKELCRQFKYISDDLLHMDQVKVYQLKSGARGRTEVKS